MNKRGEGMKDNDKHLRAEITKVLLELGIPINLQGFEFFRESVLIVIKQPSMIKKVTKGLYPQVGGYFDVKPTVVERSMRHAADHGYLKTGFRTINKYFRISDDKGWDYKPTNSELVALIAEYLKIENLVVV